MDEHDAAFGGPRQHVDSLREQFNSQTAVEKRTEIDEAVAELEALSQRRIAFEAVDEMMD